MDVEDHDLSGSRVLEDAGADTSDLGFPDNTETGDDTAEGTDEAETAEEAAEDSGLLPFVSPLTVIALIGLAAVAGNRRAERVKSKEERGGSAVLPRPPPTRPLTSSAYP